MLERRDVMGGGLAGLSALLGGGSLQTGQADHTHSDLARAIDGVREIIAARLMPPVPELEAIRQQQRVFLKASEKFPDFIEVGIGVWERVYDWHVRHQLPAGLARSSDGRYTMPFMFTTLVLRPDQADDYVGFGYDAR